MIQENTEVLGEGTEVLGEGPVRTALFPATNIRLTGLGIEPWLPR